ncbi:MAG: hypothetical protein JXR10_13050 [Cyclobacteriaceae bacterium]
MIFRKILYYLLLVCFTSVCAYAQHVQVNVDYSIQQSIGGVSTLDRSKFFKMHNGTEDAEFNQLNADYGVTVGRGFWGPYSYAKSQTGSVGSYPAPKTGNNDVRQVRNGFIATEHPRNVARYDLDVIEMADWAAEYYMDFVDQSGRGEYFEPMNEPFVHAGDSEFSALQPDDQLMRVKMAQIFGAIGEKFHTTPELANMKVIGYSSAWPSVELWDFGHWDTRMKMFMDEAGEHMDAFSTHLYDGINVTGQDTKRSGSNSEAILDLIETYSYIKWGSIKPHAISEYGGIESGYPDGYSDVKSIQSIKSINHLLFNLLNREDRMLISIPFITGKAEWHITEANNYEPYGAVLWRPTSVTPTSDPNNPTINGWQYTARIKFFQLWDEVAGDRVFIKSNNPDIQAQAFLDGDRLHVALNNLDDNTRGIDLNMLNGLNGLSSVRIRSLKIYDNDDPVYEDITQTSAPTSISLIPGETAIVSYTFNQSPTYNNSIASQYYYSDNILTQIVANTPILYKYDNVTTGIGDAVLRMSIGRKHDKSKAPIITVNGNAVDVPDNWKGYDQANRDDFFGMIEIPFPMSYLSTSNDVNITFPDSDGRVSSVILVVNKCTSNCDLSIVSNTCDDNIYENGGWSSTLANNQNLIVKESTSLNQDLIACSIEIAAGVELSVQSGSTLDLKGTLSFPVTDNNLYSVGNMESAVVAGVEWGSWTGSMNAPREFTSQAAHTGSQGLEVDFPDDGSSQWTFSTANNYRFDLVGGKTYEIRYWARTATNSGKTIDFRIVANNFSSTPGSQVKSLTETWQEFTLSITPTETKTHYVWMGFHQNKSVAGDGSNAELFYVDDIAVRDLSIPGEKGQLIIESGASLLTYNIDGNSQDVTLKRNTRFGDGRYSIVGSPVKFSSSIKGSNLGSTAWAYNEAIAYGSSGISRWVDALETELTPGAGYAQAFQETISFIGIPNDGDVVVDGLTITDGAESGWTLLSNPYPAALDVDKLMAGLSNTTQAIYLWDDHGSNVRRGDNSDYMIVNSLGDIGTGPNGGSFSGYIGSMQGFFVKLTGAATTNASITFTESMRSDGNNGDINFFRTQQETPSGNLKLALVTQDNSDVSEILIGFRADATLDIDKGYDAAMPSQKSKMSLFSLIRDERMAIQGLPPLDGLAVNIGIEVDQKESLKLNVVEMGELEEGISLILKDPYTGKSYDLDQIKEIEFTSVAGAHSKRFTLHYVSAATLNILNSTLQPVYQYSNGTLTIDFEDDLAVSEYFLYDLTGRLVGNQRSSEKEISQLEISIPVKGFMVLKMITSKGTFTRKFIF